MYSVPYSVGGSGDSVSGVGVVIRVAMLPPTLCPSPALQWFVAGGLVRAFLRDAIGNHVRVLGSVT